MRMAHGSRWRPGRVRLIDTIDICDCSYKMCDLDMVRQTTSGLYILFPPSPNNVSPVLVASEPSLVAKRCTAFLVSSGA